MTPMAIKNQETVFSGGPTFYSWNKDILKPL